MKTQTIITNNRNLENILIIGDTATGKSNMMKEIMRGLTKKQKVVVNDNKGEYVEEFYTNDKEWVILNPFDPRGYGFEILESISSNIDIDRAVAAIIQRPSGERSPIWTDTSREILKSIFSLCLIRNESKNSDILKYINMGCKNFANEIKLEKGMEGVFASLTSSETQAGNFWATFTDATRFFRSFVSAEKTINARDFVRKDPRNLILGNFAEVQEKIAPLLSLFVDCVSSEILALKVSEAKEICFFLDEFNSLKKLLKFQELLKLGGSKGATIFISTISFSLTEEKYGKAGLYDIKNNTSKKLIFNISDHEDQKMAGKLVGEETKYGFSPLEQRQTKEKILDFSAGALKENQFYFVQDGISGAKKKYVGKDCWND